MRAGPPATDDPVLRDELKEIYGSDAGAIERVDLLVGTLDRYNAQTYTQAGLDVTNAFYPWE